MTQAVLPRTLVPFFLHFLRPYRGWMVALALTGVGLGLLASAVPYMLKQIIDTLTAGGQTDAAVRAAVLPAALYVALYAMDGLMHRLNEWCKLRIFPGMRQDIGTAMFAHLAGHSHNYFLNNFAGTLAGKIGDMRSGTVSIFMRAYDFLTQATSLAFACVTLLTVHPLFSGILLAWTVLFMGYSYRCSKRVNALSMAMAESRTAAAGRVIDAITNVVNMRLFARSRHETAGVDAAAGVLKARDIAQQKFLLAMHWVQDVMILAMIGGMMALLLHFYALGRITLGDFALVITVSVTIVQWTWWISQQMAQFSDDLGTCTQALTILTAPHDVTDAPGAKLLQASRGEIVFDNVTFHYRRNANVFENKSVTIAAGSKTGLVGFSGSGKTTFVQLMLRFFDVSGGRILIDGQDIAKVTQDSLHEAVAMIPQDISLFHRSLLENIRYGRLDATDDEVIAASTQAHCHEFIMKLPDGYDTLVGERGIKLSGGQRQRIAIARAILKDAPVLILDEATSALDSVTERGIQDSLKQLMQGRTTIVIAHRLSTLAEMDRILVFDKGCVIEDGTHAGLLERGGHYARLWHMQAGGFLPAKGQ
jgi:ATP-binding cassette, subfamily B, bacterial